ncbi:MAG TPA: TonB-dependent receptor [Gammaproteobacteria bacterium]|nr:TonB-dependent receptor [Gammaproteobacteria bacterium]
MRFLYFLAACAALLMVPGVQAGALEGRVMAVTGTPISNAKLTLIPARDSAATIHLQTDGHGHFRTHDNLPSGDYTLTVTSPLGSETRQITIPATGVRSVTFHMADKIKLGTVVIAGSALQNTVLESAQPVAVLSGDELRKQMAATLGETLNTQLGVSATYFGPNASRPVIRGMSGARVRMLQDGIGALDASALSADHAVSIEPLIASRIEIIRGPATLLYGNGAFGGVVNVVTHRIPETLPVEPFYASVEARAATATGERALVAVADGTLGDSAGGQIAWHVDAYTRTTEDVEIPGEAESDILHAAEIAEHGALHGTEHAEKDAGILENSSSESEGGSLGGSWINGDNFIGLSVSFYNSLYGVPGHAHQEEPTLPPAPEPAHEEGVRIDLKQMRVDLDSGWDDPLPGLERAQFRIGYSEYEHKELEGDAVGTIFSNEGMEGRLSLTHEPWGTWQGVFGAHYLYSDFSAIGEEAFVPPVITRDLGVFIIEERTFDRAGAADWRLSVGARLDTVEHNPASGPSREFSTSALSLGSVFPFTGSHDISAHLSRAQRAPAAKELYSNGPHLATRSYETGNPALAKETAVNLDVRLRDYRGLWQWSLGVYYNQIADFIYQQNTGTEIDGLPVFSYTQADATFRGVEAESAWQFEEFADGLLEWRIYGDYTRATLDNSGQDVPRIPPLSIGTSLDYQQTRWGIGISATQYDEQNNIAPHELPTKGYLMLDANISYRLFSAVSEWFVFLRGSNLLDEEARRHTSFLKDRAPLPGRSLTLGVKASF